MNGLPLKFDPAQKLLGIYMSKTFSFQSHVDKVVAKVQKRNSILACLSTSQWGWKKKPLRKIFLATQCSVLDYAATAWQPWLANTQLERLDRAQNQALRRITGQDSLLPPGSPPSRIRCPELHDHLETTSRGFERESVQASPIAPPAHRSRRQHLPQTVQRQLEGEKQKTLRATPHRPTEESPPSTDQGTTLELPRQTLECLHHPSRKEQK